MSKKRRKPKPKVTGDESTDLRVYAAEAELVELLKVTPGWEILERDTEEYKSGLAEKLAYISPKSKDYDDARILYIASDKLIKMVSDYVENRKRALELLERLENPQDNIVFDVDN